MSGGKKLGDSVVDRGRARRSHFTQNINVKVPKMPSVSHKKMKWQHSELLFGFTAIKTNVYLHIDRSTKNNNSLKVKIIHLIFK